MATTLEFEHADLLITSLTVFFHKWEAVGPAVSHTVQAVRCELIFSWSGPGASKGGTGFIPIWTEVRDRAGKEKTKAIVLIEDPLQPFKIIPLGKGSSLPFYYLKFKITEVARYLCIILIATFVLS